MGENTNTARREKDGEERERGPVQGQDLPGGTPIQGAVEGRGSRRELGVEVRGLESTGGARQDKFSATRPSFLERRRTRCTTSSTGLATRRESTFKSAEPTRSSRRSPGWTWG